MEITDLIDGTFKKKIKWLAKKAFRQKIDIIMNNVAVVVKKYYMYEIDIPLFQHDIMRKSNTCRQYFSIETKFATAGVTLDS